VAISNFFIGSFAIPDKNPENGLRVGLALPENKNFTCMSTLKGLT
jgi:hypothetical protein